MKTKWILALGLGLALDLAGAQQAATNVQPLTAAQREELLKNPRLSPRQRAELEKAAAADKNHQASADYLAANKAKAGVTSLASGVQYRVLAAGAGKKPVDGSSVLCRIRGSLIDGTPVDKEDDKRPVPVKVAGLPPALREVVKLMPVGAKWEVVVPSKLAFGAQGGRGVGPDAVLVYVVELVGIV